MEVFIKKNYWCMCRNHRHPHTGIRRKDLHGKTDSIYSVDFEVKKYCCSDMKWAIANNMIFLGCPDDYMDCNVNVCEVTNKINKE